MHISQQNAISKRIFDSGCLLITGIIILAPVLSSSAVSEVNFEFAPPKWQTAICEPDDPCKTLVDHEGKLLYHFNKMGGTFDTTMYVVVDKKAELTSQELLSPRIPIVRTIRGTDSLLITEEAFTVTNLPAGKLRESQPLENDVVLVMVTNRGDKTDVIHPEFVVRSNRGVAVLNDHVLRVTENENILSTHPVKKISIERKRFSVARMLLRPISIKAGETAHFAFWYGTGTAPVPIETILEKRNQAERYWNNISLPYDSITVPDPGIQGLVDSSIRNIWQAREFKDGLPAFQVGPTCYRGLWVVDGAFLLEAAALVGAGDEARAGVQYMLSKQSPSGAFEVLTPKYYKENGIVLWTCTRHARLTQDKEWLKSVWPQLEKAVAFVKILRERSYEDSEWLCHDLIPPGDIDGGLWNSHKGEYTNVYWNLLGLKAAIEAAHWLDKTEQAQAWQQEYDDFMAAFRARAALDMRKDDHGNHYLPTIMDNIGEELPQRAQWAFCHAIYPGQIFDKDDPLVAGNLAMLEATEQEGMVYGTGWDPEGFWNYFASFYGHAWLWQGNGAKAADALYAFANHASPLLAWREEQAPKGKPFRQVGDMPHNWASAEFIRLTVHLLALDRGNELHLFEGLPPAWTQPGMVTALKNVATPFGPLTFSLEIDESGESAKLTIEPLTGNSCEKIVVYLDGWADTSTCKTIELKENQKNIFDIPMTKNNT